MFEGLKKKFSSFVDSLSKKESDAGQVTLKHESNQNSGDLKDAYSQDVDKQKTTEQHQQKVATSAHIRTEIDHENEPRQTQPSIETKKSHREVEKHASDTSTIQEPIEITGTGKGIQPSRPVMEGHPLSKEPNITAATRIKGFVFGHVKISDKDAYPFIEELKMGLLQSDVNYDVAEKVAEGIRINLIGKEADSKNIVKAIRQGIMESIIGVLSKRAEVDIIKEISYRKEGNELPYKILFLGPNGAGKTTTMAKIANLLLSNDITCVLSASDTFRAAAIEQTVYHAGKLGINVIKGTYGADPASVAFDAIAHAKAHNTMVVLIDSAEGVACR